jgi:hypothetical protein
MFPTAPAPHIEVQPPYQTHGPAATTAAKILQNNDFREPRSRFPDPLCGSIFRGDSKHPTLDARLVPGVHRVPRLLVHFT